MPFLPFFSMTDLLLLVPAMLFALWAQFKVRSTYNKYSQVMSRRGTSGAQVAADLLRLNGIGGVNIDRSEGMLSDYYDPTKKEVRLSEDNYHSTSIAALSVAAHEVGHAIQHKLAYAPLNFRTSLFPVANIGSTLAMPLFFIGFLFKFPFLVDVGIVFFAGAVLFQVVTLPVEFDASRRALQQLQSRGFLAQDEIKAARKVLTAAALTYVAAAAVAVLHLVRLLLIREGSDE
jgi:hypothetical protein